MKDRLWHTKALTKVPVKHPYAFGEKHWGLSRMQKRFPPQQLKPRAVTLRTPNQMPAVTMRFQLSAGERLPSTLNWLVQDGYLAASSWGVADEPQILGIWGPGELFIPQCIKATSLEVVALSAVDLEQVTPSMEEEREFSAQFNAQLIDYLKILGLKSAELRLLHLLLWFGERYGRVNSQGISLSMAGMNLTHNNLSIMTGLTRVTVTKTLGKLRFQGLLSKLGEDDLLRPW